MEKTVQTAGRNRRSYHTRCVLRRLAKSLGSFQSGQRSMGCRGD